VAGGRKQVAGGRWQVAGRKSRVAGTCTHQGPVASRCNRPRVCPATCHLPPATCRPATCRPATCHLLPATCPSGSSGDVTREAATARAFQRHVGFGRRGRSVRIPLDRTRARWTAQGRARPIAGNQMQGLRRVVCIRTWLAHMSLQGYSQARRRRTGQSEVCFARLPDCPGRPRWHNNRDLSREATAAIPFIPRSAPGVPSPEKRGV
jgi:hypothetical protein